MPIQAIGAGYGRTGTYSLCPALEKLGAYENKDHEDEWEKVYGDYDAAVDNPTVPFYKELAERYPEAKVILTVRSADNWYNSLCKTVFQIQRFHFPEDFPESARKMLGVTRVVSWNGYWKDDPVREPNKKELCKIFNDHIEEVKGVIPPERLRIMELGECWERICKFLGKEILDEPYPRLNESEGFMDRWLKTIEMLNIVEHEMAART